MIISASVNLVDVACWAAIAVAVLGAVVGWALSEHNSRISRIASAMTNIEQRLAEVNAQRAEEQGRLQPRGTSGEPGSPPGCSGNLTTGTLGVSGAVTSFHIHGAFHSLTENFFLAIQDKTPHTLETWLVGSKSHHTQSQRC